MSFEPSALLARRKSVNYTGAKVVVTGASSGLGTEYAREFAKRGASLVLVARSEDVLNQLADDLKLTHGTTSTVLALDLSAPGAGKKLYGAHPDADVLINNAGFATSGMLAAQDDAGRDRTVEEVQLNCVTLADLTQRYLPGMVERDRGTIVNISSVTAFQPIPTMAAYAATKAFVLNFTEAVASEVSNTSLRVLAVCPGPTATNFFTTANANPPGGKTRTPYQVVASTMRALERGKFRVVDGLANSATGFFGKHSPDSWVMPLAGRMMQ